MQKRDNVERKLRADSGSRRPVARGGRLLKWKGKVASVAPSVFICLVGVGAVLAGISSAQTISEEQDTPLVVTMDEDVIITPTGSIEVGTPSESAISITDFLSDFINRGKIRISTTLSTGEVQDVYGDSVRVSGSVISPGRFENHGMVEATAEADRTEDNGLEFQLRGFLFNRDAVADFTNTGQITVTADTNGYAEADAVAFEGDVQGNITNAGVVTTRVTGDTSAAVTGYNFSNEFTGDFTNSGTIIVEVNSPSVVSGKKGVSVADAVYVGMRMIGDISNSGIIVADATAQDRATARGYRVLNGLGCPPYDPEDEEATQIDAETDCPEDGIKGNFTNSGTITVNAESQEKNAVASGVHLHNDVFGDISNSGAITVTGEKTVEGIRAGDTLNGTFRNTGTVAACATSSEVCTRSSEAGTEVAKKAEVRGVYIDDSIDNSFAEETNVDNITNEGDVVARAHAREEASATAYFIPGDLGDHFTNNGDIIVEAVTRDENSNKKAEADGVHVIGSIGRDHRSKPPWSTRQQKITNSGEITVTAKGASQATANGVRLAGDAGRMPVIPMPVNPMGEDAYDPVQIIVSNSGEITVMADAVSVAEANGFVVGGTFYGVFSNTEEISSTAMSTGDEATANGVHLGDDMTMNVIIPNAGDGLTNAGSVKASASAKTMATARAWFLDGALIGDFTNRGSSAAEATSTGDAAEADGVHVSGPMTGDITSAGVTTAGATAQTKATARVWYLGGGLTGDFINANTGSIAAEAVSTEAEAVADGVHVSGPMTGDITSAGVTTAGATAQTKATARVWYLGGGLTGDFINANTGSIAAEAVSTEAEAVADGVHVSSGSMTGTISNVGTITATAKGATKATARGLYAPGMVAGIENTGMISALAEAPDGAAYGIYAEDVRGDGIKSDGAITVTATGGDAYGIYAEDVRGDGIKSDGAITVTATGGDAYGIRAENVVGWIQHREEITVEATDGKAYGIRVENHEGVAEIFGRIIAVSNTGDDAYAIYLEGGHGDLKVNTEDRITGLLRIAAHDVTLDARGDSTVYYFEDSLLGDGKFTTTASDGRSVWFTRDKDGKKPIYAAVNPIHVLTSRDIVANTGTIIGGIADRVTASARPGDANAANDAADAAPSVAERFGLNRLGRFASISADSSEFEIVRNFEGDRQTYDGNIGVTGVTDGGAAFALGMGIFRAEGDAPATEFESDALYLTAAYGRSFGTLDFAASLGFGWLTNEKSRRIFVDVTDEFARAEYDSTLLTADFGVGKAFDVGAGTGWDLGMNGFGTIRYTRQVDDGYTETGSRDVNAKVGKAVTEVLEATAGVEIEKQFPGKVGTLSGGISGVFRTNLTDPGAKVRVLSTTETLTLAASDFSGANLRLGYEKELIPGMLLDVSAEQEVGTGAKGPNVRALINWSF